MVIAPLNRTALHTLPIIIVALTENAPNNTSVYNSNGFVGSGSRWMGKLVSIRPQPSIHLNFPRTSRWLLPVAAMTASRSGRSTCDSLNMNRRYSVVIPMNERDCSKFRGPSILQILSTSALSGATPLSETRNPRYVTLVRQKYDLSRLIVMLVQQALEHRVQVAHVRGKVLAVDDDVVQVTQTVFPCQSRQHLLNSSLILGAADRETLW